MEIIINILLIINIVLSCGFRPKWKRHIHPWWEVRWWWGIPHKKPDYNRLTFPHTGWKWNIKNLCSLIALWLWLRHVWNVCVSVCVSAPLSQPHIHSVISLCVYGCLCLRDWQGHGSGSGTLWGRGRGVHTHTGWPGQPNPGGILTPPSQKITRRPLQLTAQGSGLNS